MENNSLASVAAGIAAWIGTMALMPRAYMASNHPCTPDAVIGWIVLSSGAGAIAYIAAGVIAARLKGGR